jgi:hypothetical protein
VELITMAVLNIHAGKGSHEIPEAITVDNRFWRVSRRAVRSKHARFVLLKERGAVSEFSRQS